MQQLPSYSSQSQQSFPPQSYLPAKKSRPFLIIGVIALGIVIIVSISIFAQVNAVFRAPAQMIKVGQTITLNGVSATLMGVGTLYYDAPQVGSPEDIAVHVKLVNNSGSEITYSPFNFHVKSGTGTITGIEIIPPSMYQSNNLLPTGHLIPGGTAEGDVLFQVTSGDHQVAVTWQPTSSDSDSANGWMLGM